MLPVRMTPHDTQQPTPSSPPPHNEQGAGVRIPFLGVGLAMLFAATAFFSGFHIGGGEARLQASIGSLFAADKQQAASVDMSDFWRVWHLLENKFVAPTSTVHSDQERVWGAIEGLVRSYDDPYTVFLPPEDAALFQENISGNFSGVGMEIGIRNEAITIVAPLPDTPAVRAGLLSGDVIVRIDQTQTEGMSIDEAIRRIRGEKGTEVMLTIFREGETEFLEVPVVRDIITIPTIETSVEDGVFTIRLFSFNAISEAHMQRALRQYALSGTDKLILDLRGNPGGFLQSAVEIAGYFLPTGKVVVREHFGEGRDERVYRSMGATLGRFAPERMVVLIDGGSASASEILAGALGEHDIATLIGTQTFGKGSVQELVELSDSSSLKVTVARWLTPEGVSISEGGLTPDIEVPRTPKEQQEGHDPQREAALTYLRDG